MLCACIEQRCVCVLWSSSDVALQQWNKRNWRNKTEWLTGNDKLQLHLDENEITLHISLSVLVRFISNRNNCTLHLSMNAPRADY